MTQPPSAKFPGFSPRAFALLAALRAHNTRPWFEGHKAEIAREVLEPLRALSAGLSESMLTLDGRMEIDPKKTLSRIYRDVRFSKDKSPYKTALWLTFKRPSAEWQEAPAYFFEIHPEGVRYGMGFYLAGKPTMDRLRRDIDRGDPGFMALAGDKAWRKRFAVAGDDYRRVLNPDLPPALKEWYQKKSLYFLCEHPARTRALQAGLLDDVLRGFVLLAPWYEYFWTLKA